jgi:Xaa-Pro aminopeptidase
MTTLNWHRERYDLSDLQSLDRSLHGSEIDLVSVRAYRLGRVRAEMRKRDIAALIISDPVNIRYATGARNMQIFCARNTPSRYLIVTESRTILFEFTGCEHLADGLETIDEIRPSSTASFVAAGPAIVAREKAWAADMVATLTELVGPKPTVGIERMNAGAAIALAGHGVRLVDAQEPIETARAIKSAEELKCVIASLRATEAAVGKLRDAIQPGMSENELWSVLHQSVIAQDGDYVETRLLSAGRRTNPWFQETSRHVIEPNQLIALDTDVVGCHGYYSDFSRTFHAGPDKPSENQRTLYKLAHEQVHHNIGIIRPGMTFREYSDKAWNIPDKYHANRYWPLHRRVGVSGRTH